MHYEKFWMEAGFGTGRYHYHRNPDYSYNGFMRGLLVLLVWCSNVSFL